MQGMQVVQAKLTVPEHKQCRKAGLCFYWVTTNTELLIVQYVWFLYIHQPWRCGLLLINVRLRTNWFQCSRKFHWQNLCQRTQALPSTTPTTSPNPSSKWRSNKRSFHYTQHWTMPISSQHSPFTIKLPTHWSLLHPNITIGFLWM